MELLVASVDPGTHPRPAMSGPTKLELAHLTLARPPKTDTGRWNTHSSAASTKTWGQRGRRMRLKLYWPVTDR
ncbi:hypothetical protein E2C01_051618 [Portunus trituberculatus]|uniref:Uncharacterized protein n=1 Tax=Portunus trituberculatus TaxID=210409 RepID=A0A5B7GJK9_PORTR|nr:hypothetical protein [Portunus trituberculatus]